MNLSALVGIGLPFAVSLPFTKISSVSYDRHYKDIVPSWSPPKWIFPPVWSYLFSTMGYASYLVWSSGNSSVTNALIAYGFQLGFNALWTPLFFGYRRPGLALVDIFAMLISIGSCVVLFYPINKVASYLMVPYFLWVSFATSINFSVWWNMKK